MLKYNISIHDTVDDEMDLSISHYYLTSLDDDNKVLAVCEPETYQDRCAVGEELKILNVTEYPNDYDDGNSIVDIQSFNSVICTVNNDSGIYSFKIPKYRTIGITTINEVEIDGLLYWQLYFEDGHFFSEDAIDIKLIISWGVSSSERVELTDVEYVNCKTLQWEVRDDVDHFNTLLNVVFSTYNYLQSRITIIRSQTLINETCNFDITPQPKLTVTRPRLHIDIPFTEKFETNLTQQESIRTELVDKEVKKAIPSFIEMEKVVYSPVIMNTTETEYTPITKINFNLHFRQHSGDDWTVKENDDWNFSAYGYNQANDSYYSYNNISNQSDLLGYLNFTNKDVANQKNKLQKSFLRLSFYDSTNTVNQNMLAYSTIFFNTNKLYSKYLRGQRLDDWYVNEKDTFNKFDAISTKFELDVHNNHKIPVSIKRDDEKIEEYRLSSQFSVTNKYSSNISSEGFYLYLWADNKTVIPENLYMKVEFNHAGYGRTIPMMAPYFIKGVDTIPEGRDNLFKTNDEIKSDWNGNGYGVLKYNEYSYIRLKYKYDSDNKRYIYYIDPEYYGVIEGPIVNINLYEARITF